MRADGPFLVLCAMVILSASTSIAATVYPPLDVPAFTLAALQASASAAIRTAPRETARRLPDERHLIFHPALRPAAGAICEHAEGGW